MGWDRCGLHFRPVERGDLERLREYRNRNVHHLRYPLHVWGVEHEGWFASLGAGNQAFIVEDNDPDQDEKVVEVSRLVGLVRLTNWDWQNRSVGYTGCDVFERQRGKGYGTAVTRAVAEYALLDLGLHRIWGQPMSHAPAMLRSFRSAGYVEEGRERQALWRGEQGWQDFVRFGMLEDEVGAPWGRVWPRSADRQEIVGFGRPE